MDRQVWVLDDYYAILKNRPSVIASKKREVVYASGLGKSNLSGEFLSYRVLSLFQSHLINRSRLIAVFVN